MLENHWLVGSSVAAFCVGLEAWLSGPRPFAFLKSLRQPAWALPTWAWIGVGGLFYVVMIYAAGMVLQHGAEASFTLALVVSVMLTDGFWNYLLFRARRIDWAYLYLFPYTALVALAAYMVYAVDPLAGGSMAIYLAFLPYDIAWTRALGRLNPELARA